MRGQKSKGVTMPLTRDEIQSGLLSLYEKAKERAQIVDLARISDGWENDVYSFALEYEQVDGRQREDLILRIYPGDDAPQKSAREFDAMKQLYTVGYPVPQVLQLEADGALLGKPFVIMERIVGRSMGAIADESPMQRKLELLTLLCKLFVNLHALEWRSFAEEAVRSDAPPLSAALSDMLTEWQSYVRGLQITAFDPVFDWLQAQLADVEFGQPSVLHMDYHPYNILMREDGAAFVIDWGAVMVSDYRIDLAWTLLLMSSYGTPEVRDMVLGGYERAAGQRVNQIAYFDVIACLRRLFDISASLSVGADKMGMRPGAEAMMKNAAHIENVYAFLHKRTDISIAEVEKLLSTLQ
jgi:aminoglycoside phosphotransferase (APT) family kinase protein